MVIGCFPDLCVADVPRSIDAYRTLFDLDVRVDHGWYAELGTADTTLIAFVERDHETVPAAARQAPAGVLVTFTVDDAKVRYGHAIESGWPIVVDLVSELGQRHFMAIDPDGTIVDVIEPIPLTAHDRRRLVQLRRRA
jgi:predicted enzyme related to lactoylglutathione lyase